MFDEILVIDYITDINELSESDVAGLVDKVNDSYLLKNCPNGTVIGKRISSSENTQSMIFYPFFSHIRTPVKAGERAWAFSPPGRGPSYWITRKVQDSCSEDPNFTFEGRSRVAPDLIDKKSGRKNLISTFQDSRAAGASISDVIKSAISRSEFIGEPTLNVKSKSTDFCLQGSNGAIIKLGNESSAGSATINLVAGLATTDSIESIQNSNKFTGKSYKETIKPLIGSDSSSEERSNAVLAGSLSADDPSRLIISQKFSADSYYSFEGDNAGEVPTISLKTDCVRIIAQNDLKIVVGTSSDPSSIIMKSNGDIIITPSSLGIIKLGGEDATGAILASVESIVTAGKVEAPSLVSTAGGILGAPALPATGIFSTKVLVKVT